MLYHGADYNPDQWLDRPDILRQDIEFMKKARVNVVSVGIFSWSLFEPEEGVFQFDWLAKIVDELWANGIGINLATPSGARPAWMARRYEEVRRVNARRERELYGNRHNHCYTSPVYREKVRRINQQLAERFGKHPAFIRWHISNEYGGECHCPLCQSAFQRWLREKYGTLEALNRAWNTAFWSHTYTEWSQIESPSPIGESAMQGLALDWKRFVSHQTIDFMKWERDCVREILPESEITVNMMYRFDGIDYYKMADEIDLVSWDSYPCWHTPGVPMPQTALDTALNHDIFYSLKHKPFWLMESTPSCTNWQPVSKLKKPGVAQLAALQAIAHGSDSVLYFQWRQSPGAFEKFHGAVVSHDCREDNRVFSEVCEIGRALETLSCVAGAYKPKQAAIVHDYENKWAMELSKGPRNCGMGYWEELSRHYDGLSRNGYTVDFVNEDGNLDGYGLVVVPMLYLLREDFARKLRRFTEAGGRLVVTYWSGVVNENDRCWLGDAPHGLTDVLGLRRAEIDSLYDGETRRCEATDARLSATAVGSALCEVAVPEGATTLMRYAEDYFAGSPAVCEHRFGKGTAYYIATRFESAFYVDFYRIICEDLFEPAAPCALPETILSTRRGPYLFLQNFSEKPAACALAELPAYGTAVFEEKSEGFRRIL